MLEYMPAVKAQRNLHTWTVYTEPLMLEYMSAVKAQRNLHTWTVYTEPLMLEYMPAVKAQGISIPAKSIQSDVGIYVSSEGSRESPYLDILYRAM